MRITIITHQQFDLDAAVSAWLLLLKHPEAEVEFANTTSDDNSAIVSRHNPPETYVVDIKGSPLDKSHDEADGQCSSRIVYEELIRPGRDIPEVLSALEDMVALSESQDKTGKLFPPYLVPFSIVGFIKGAQSIGWRDEMLWPWVKRQLDFSYQFLYDHHVARQNYLQMRQAQGEVQGYTVDYIRGGGTAATDVAYNVFNVDIVVYEDPKTFNLGAIRRNECPLHLGEKLKRFVSSRPEPERSRWFSHPAGFIVAHGTQKFPATEPAGVTGRELFEAICAP